MIPISCKHPRPLRLWLALCFLCTVLITLISLWFITPHGHSRSTTHGGNAIVLGQTALTNGYRNTCLLISNKLATPLIIETWLYIQYASSAMEEFRHVSDAALPLAPGAVTQICFPAPTNSRVWRAEVACVEQSQFERAARLNRWLPQCQPIRRHVASLLTVHPRYIRTRWVTNDQVQIN